MVEPSQIQPHMEVLDSEDNYCGLVTGVMGAEIELAEGHEVGDRHGRIPIAWIAYTWDHKLKLTLTCAQAKARWRERETH